MTKQEFLDKLQYRVTVLSQDDHYAAMLSEESTQRAGFSDLLTFAFYQLSGWVPASDKTISEIADEADENVLSRMGNALASGTKVMWFKDGIALEDIKDREGSTNPIDLAKYDLNGDGQIDEDDVDVFVNGPDSIIMTTESNHEVMAILNDNGVFEGTEMKKSDAAKITGDQIGGIFEMTDIKTFNEFKYFTGVTFIDELTFSGCTELTSITIPNSIIRIEQVAFGGCQSITELTIPSGVTSIGHRAFGDTFNLTTFTCLATTAPEIQSTTFEYMGDNASMRTLRVPTGATGYDQGYWLELQTRATAPFTIEYI